MHFGELCSTLLFVNYSAFSALLGPCTCTRCVLVTAVCAQDGKYELMQPVCAHDSQYVLMQSVCAHDDQCVLMTASMSS